MKFGLAQYSNFSTEQSSLITNLSDLINDFLVDKSYGNDIKEIYVGIICVKPEFDQFFKTRKIKYHKGVKSFKSKIDKELIVTEDCLEYDLKFDYLEIGKLHGKDLIDVIYNSLIESVSELKKLKTIKHFDFDSFGLDIKKLKIHETATNRRFKNLLVFGKLNVHFHEESFILAEKTQSAGIAIS